MAEAYGSMVLYVTKDSDARAARHILPTLVRRHRRRGLETTKSARVDTGHHHGGSGTTTLCRQVMEGSWGGWPAVKHHVLTVFRASYEGVLPTQWKHAKIIPLKKPGKDDYTFAKAWRPISLPATLGKILESVIAERISYAVETYGILPINHFGARKQRSAEQALLLLQEQILTAWRGRKILSLISFDVKGAYNGVCKEKLLQRMKREAYRGDSRGG